MAKYWTLNGTTGRLEALAVPIKVDGWPVIHPTAQQAALYDAYPKAADAETPPEAPQGQMAVADGWTLREGEWVRTWRFEPLPPAPPRRWSRLSIKTALAQAGMLGEARSYLSNTEIARGYTAWEALTDCDYIEEGYGGAEAWSALLDGAAQALGKTREEIDAFLDVIPTEG